MFVSLKLTNDSQVNKSILQLSLSPEIPKKGDTVIVLIESFPEKLKSCSFLQANPLVFKIGDGQIFKGLEIAVFSMRKGEVSLIEMTAEYMKEIKDIKFPSTPFLMFPFVIRLLDIVQEGSKNTFQMQEEEKKFKSNIKKEYRSGGFENILKLKEIGNQFYKEADYVNAQKAYNQALSSLELCKQDSKYKEVQCILCSNLSAVYLKIGHNSKAIEFCSKAIELDPFNVKALFRRALAYINLSNNVNAFSDLQLATKFEPENEEIAAELKKLKDKLPISGRPASNFSNKNNPTAFLDISIDGENLETLEIELFKNIVPKTVENFMAICLGEHCERGKGKRKKGIKVFYYKGSIFHKFLKGVLIQGGDFEKGNGSGGKSIYGKTFTDENFQVQHSCRGVLSMANQGKKDSNGSQFFITFKETPAFDGKNVAFGIVKEGWAALDRLENVPCNDEKPNNVIRIMDCFAADVIFMTKNENENLIIKKFIQKKFEYKAEKEKSYLRFEYKKNRILFRKKGELYNEFKKMFDSYTSDIIELNFDVFDFARGDNLKVLKENYQKLLSPLREIFRLFKLGGTIATELEKLNNSEANKEFYVIKNHDASDYSDQQSNHISIKIEVIFKIELKTIIISKIQNIIQMFAIYPLIFPNQRPLDFNPKCFTIDLPELPNITFLVGTKMSINDLRNKYEQKTMRIQINGELYKLLSDNVMIFKEFKIQLIGRLGFPIDSEITLERNNLQIVSTFDLKEFKNKLMDFANNYMSNFRIKCPLSSTEMNFCKLNPKVLCSLKEMLKVDFKFSESSKEDCYFEICKDNRKLLLFKSSMADFQETSVVINSLSHFGTFSGNIISWPILGYNSETNCVRIIRSGKTLNVSWPHQNLILDKKMYLEMVENCLRMIVNEGEIQQIKILLIPFFGFGVFEAKFEEIFIIYMKVFQEEFFPKANFLKEIYLVEDDEKIAEKLKNLMTDFLSREKISKENLKYIWKWQTDNKDFEAYDNKICQKINEAYENNPNRKYEIVIDPLKKPGTHQFDLGKKIVTDLTLQKEENLTCNFGIWFHNNIPYSSEISKAIQKKMNETVLVFVLFVKCYYLDFVNMVQINQQSSFKRSIKLELNNDYENFNFIKDVKTSNYDKITIFDEPNSLEPNHFVEIISKSEVPNALEAQKQLKETIRSNVESIKLKLPLFISASKIKIITSFCKKEKIHVDPNEIKSGQFVNFECHKSQIQVLEQRIKELEYDYPWDNGPSDFQIITLNQMNDSKDYNYVLSEFRITMSSNYKVISITRVQNNDLYTNFQNSVRSCLQFKEKNGITFDKDDDGFLYLWHGTKNMDPSELIERKTSALSTQYASDNSMWGRGIYFAKNALYSDNFSFKKEKGIRGIVKYLLFCKVFIGKSIKMKSDPNIREPPYMDKIKKIFYDSIEGETGNSIVYILYENDRCYPHYLVEYSCE